MSLRTVVVIAVALACAGCPESVESTGEEVPLDEPRTLEAEGEFVHGLTGMVFPPSIGEFVRVDIAKYDRDALHVSVGYDRHREDGPVPVPLVTLTLYVYPTRAKMEAELASIGQHIEESYDEAELVESRPTMLMQGERSFAGLRSTYRYRFQSAQGPVSKLTDTYLFRAKKGETAWRVKYRISYPAEFEKDLAPEIRVFLETMRLP